MSEADLLSAVGGDEDDLKGLSKSLHQIVSLDQLGSKCLARPTPVGQQRQLTSFKTYTRRPENRHMLGKAYTDSISPFPS